MNNNYISIDETSVELFSKPNKGYAKCGHRCIVSKSNKKKRYSLLTAINKNKIVKSIIVNGSVNGDFIKGLPKGTLFMDNARIYQWK